MNWIGSGLLLLGAWLLGKKLRWGWICNILGSLTLLVYLWGDVPLVILQIVFILLSIKGFLSWNINNEETN